MKKITILLLCAATIAYVYGATNTCPAASKMVSCAPKCKDDTECHGTKCCPNICNAKSCAPANSGSNSGSGGQRGSASGTGSYCGNVKCNSYEKCQLDKTSKREKCIRT